MAARIKGFTLIELLIAMAILAIAMGALIQTASYQAVNASNLRDRTIAQWVAANKLAELQTTKTWEKVGKRRGESEMANAVWYWETEVLKVNDEDLRRVEISVRKTADSKNLLYKLPGFLSSPNVFSSGNEEEQ